MNPYFFSDSDGDIEKEQAKSILWKTLQESENFLYLIWAGCSVKSWWKTMKVIWTEFETLIPNFVKLKSDAWYSVWNNLEDLLSQIKITEDYLVARWKSAEKDEMKNFRESIEDKLMQHCKSDIKIWPDSKHGMLVNKSSQSRNLSLPRVKIFTLNYDNLFEVAWNEWGFTIIDWFSFSLPRTFNGTNFDLDIIKRNKNYLNKDDNFERKVFHLYKLHGSINWDEDLTTWKIIQKDAAKWKIINPWSSKYEESYMMPYFEMMSRFQQELRKESVTLTIIGYSFADKHINSMINEAFKINPSLRIIVVGTSIFDPTKKVLISSEINILNQWLLQWRVFLFNMYFEPFLELMPWKEIKTKDEEIIEKLAQLTTST